MTATQFMCLRGSDYEIGRQHAEQMSVPFQESMAGFYSDLWNYMQNVPFSDVREQWGLKLLSHSLFPVLKTRLLRGVPPFARERIRGMSDVLRVPMAALETAVVLPDLLPLLQSLAVRMQPSHFSPVIEVPTLGCSSLVSIGRSLVHGRNLDFPGMGYWDRSPVIQLTETKGALKTVSFTTASVPVGGITALNEAGISVCLHQHYSRNWSTRGAPPFAIAEAALQRFSKLEDIVDYISRERVSSAWAFVICDGKTKHSVVLEKDARHCGIRSYDSSQLSFSHSNYFQTQACQGNEYSISEKMSWDNHARKLRLDQLSSEMAGQGGPIEIARAMSDHWDPYWQQTKLVNRTVSQAFNIQSVVMDLTEMKVWIAEGASPVHLREYCQYDLSELFSGRVPSAISKTQVCTLANQPLYAQAKTDLVQAFIEAFGRRFGAARERLEKVAGAAPCTETYLALTAMRLKCGDFTGASESVDAACHWAESRAREMGKSQMPPEYFEARLKRAHCADLLGKRSDAKKQYRALELEKGLKDVHIRREAKRAKPYKPYRLDKLLVPFSTYFPSD